MDGRCPYCRTPNCDHKFPRNNAVSESPSLTGLDAQVAKTTITMFITFMQNKGVWPCTVKACEFPRELSAKKVLEIKDEFVAKMCN